MSENRLVRLALPVLGLVLLIVGWHAYVVAFDVPVAVLPRPALVLDSMIANWRLIVEEGWITLLESLYGFILAFVLGVPLAVAIAGSRTLNLMFRASQHPGGIPRPRHGGAGKPLSDLLENSISGRDAVRHLGV